MDQISNPKPQDFRFLTQALYAVISSPPNGRNWDAIKSFYHPEARLVRTAQHPATSAESEVFSFDQYIQNVETALHNIEFSEVEIAHSAQVFGNVAQVASTYEFTAKSPSGENAGRGVNFLTLIYNNRRWQIMSIIWDNEREGQMLPVTLLAT